MDKYGRASGTLPETAAPMFALMSLRHVQLRFPCGMIIRIPRQFRKVVGLDSCGSTLRAGCTDRFQMILMFALLSASRKFCIGDFTVLSILRGFLTVGVEGAEFRGSLIYSSLNCLTLET